MLSEGADVLGLGYVEHLLVWSLRRLATGRGVCPQMAREFSDACGDDADEVFDTFRLVIRMVVYAGRRRLRVGSPGQLRITCCERQILNVIAAAQAGDQDRFDALLRWMARTDVRHELAMAVRAFATALSAHRLILPLPALAPPPRNLAPLLPLSGDGRKFQFRRSRFEER
jgi:hypothetical protein